MVSGRPGLDLGRVWHGFSRLWDGFGSIMLDLGRVWHGFGEALGWVWEYNVLKSMVLVWFGEGRMMKALVFAWFGRGWSRAVASFLS